MTVYDRHYRQLSPFTATKIDHCSRPSMTIHDRPWLFMTFHYGPWPTELSMNVPIHSWAPHIFWTKAYIINLVLTVKIERKILENIPESGKILKAFYIYLKHDKIVRIPFSGSSAQMKWMNDSLIRISFWIMTLNECANEVFSWSLTQSYWNGSKFWIRPLKKFKPLFLWQILSFSCCSNWATLTEKSAWFRS